MTRIQRVLILVFILLSLLPVYYVNKWLQKVIQPRRSFGHFMLYLVACLVLVFAYTFLVVAIISWVFPPERG
jgi:hypothetical protein